jgi:ubiquinone/menaquinone biosynthesis C-methylase UbiE
MELAARHAVAVGVDPSSEMISAAGNRWPGLDFRVGNAYELPFGDGTVAGYRADKVFHEIGDPARALAEARRVLQPGGRIVLVGQDWDTIVIDSDDPALTRRLVHNRADTITNPRAARQYRNLLLDEGFVDVVTEVHTAVYTEPAMVRILSGFGDPSWFKAQTERAEAGRLFIAVPFFLVAARSPAELVALN